MTNPLNQTFDLTPITNTSIIDTPVDWLYYIDGFLNHYMIIGILLLIGVVLFFGMKKVINSEVEALGFSSIIITFFGLLLFLAKTTAGESLLSFAKLSPFVIITLIVIYINFSNRKY